MRKIHHIPSGVALRFLCFRPFRDLPYRALLSDQFFIRSKSGSGILSARCPAMLICCHFGKLFMHSVLYLFMLVYQFAQPPG